MMMILLDYGMRYLAFYTSNTCSNYENRIWSPSFPTYTFPKEFVKDAFLENILKRSLRKGWPRGPPLL
jgi:hypothetical protein